MLTTNKKLIVFASIILTYLGSMPRAEAGFQYRMYQPGVRPFETSGGSIPDGPQEPVLTHELLVATPAINFGTVGTATPVPSILLYLVNTGTAPVFISNLEVDGSTDISAFDYGCYQATIEPGGTCPISVGYDPVTIGSVATNIRVTSDAQTPIQTITVTGVGSGSGSPSIFPSKFSDYFVAESNATSENLYSFNNYGLSSVVITNAAISGDSSFSIVANTCSIGAEVSPFSGCGITVRFSPGGVTPAIARASLTVNIAGKSATIQFVGKKL